ncbi:sugar lactone lactonase YvrE [Sphingomonas jinjuensis]|uniref:Sugar lactone lactonase YvrE n=1 Tax=Sphingomonas jinjuensis TaxID=535907 RepID=A0A840FJ48_9SPHN|nr:SMP-30/gluconolactonase/LRE family protein [Sphingomonas jinjuensis]MBB4155737.1 sugar lactone lactonase YvrE [Sphingomonas jinjuensis]
MGLPAEPEQRGRFVLRIDPAGALGVVADGFDQPNGIVFSPDGRTLYVSDTGGALNPEGPREIRAFDVIDGVRLARERHFATLDHGIPDGLTVDNERRVYAATADGAAIWSPAGEPLGIIPTPVTCGNLAFGGRDGRTLFLCATDRVFAIDTMARGWT